VAAGGYAFAAPEAKPRVVDFPGGPYFISLCGVTHRSNDDPIVYPGQPGRSHNHTFIGNRTTNASSTPASLRGQATRCRPAADTSAYWVPTLFAEGRPVAPLATFIYYVRRTSEPVRPLPAGLKMIAGDARATRAQSTRVTYWTCSAPRSSRAYARVPNCPEEETLSLHVNFAECWDGRRLDSSDHMSHMAYSSEGRCRASHPVAVPAIALLMLYPGAGPGAELSSGRFSGHADFVNAWDQVELARLIDGLLN
jgi:hypothetical protein